jgi:hypothetical protein
VKTMRRDILKQVKESSIYPDHLMADVARSTLARTFVLSLIIHVAVLGLTSIRYIGLCFEHKTWQPDEVIKELRAEAERVKLEEARQARLAEQQAAAQKAAAGAKPAPAATTPDEAPAPGESVPEGDAEKSPIEKTLEEVSHERPTEPSATFENVDEL